MEFYRHNHAERYAVGTALHLAEGQPLRPAYLNLVCRHQFSGLLFGGTARFSSAIRSRRKMMASTSAYTARPARTMLSAADRMPRKLNAGLRLNIATPK